MNQTIEKFIPAFFAFIGIISIIISFFMGLIPSELFVGIISSLIVYYYKEDEVKKLSKQLESKDDQISALSINKKINKGE